MALRAVDLSGHQDGAALDVLAAAYATAGRFDEAQKTAEAAAVTAPSSPSLLLRIEDHLRLFRAGQAVVVP